MILIKKDFIDLIICRYPVGCQDKEPRALVHECDCSYCLRTMEEVLQVVPIPTVILFMHGFFVLPAHGIRMLVWGRILFRLQ